VADLSQDRREVRILAMGVDTTTPTGTFRSKRGEKLNNWNIAA
jgi:hypothetical protein